MCHVCVCAYVMARDQEDQWTHACKGNETEQRRAREEAKGDGLRKHGASGGIWMYTGLII